MRRADDPDAIRTGWCCVSVHDGPPLARRRGLSEHFWMLGRLRKVGRERERAITRLRKSSEHLLIKPKRTRVRSRNYAILGIRSSRIINEAPLQEEKNDAAG